MAGSEPAAYLDWLSGHGVVFEVAAGLERDPDHEGAPIVGDAPVAPIELPGIPPFVEHRDPAAGISSDHATLTLARALLPGIETGCRFWDIGCGTAVLAVAAGLKGARSVLGTDVDEAALLLARRTASEANIAVQFLCGSLLAGVPETRQADVVVANLPHKPVPVGQRLPVAQHGGPGGDAVHHIFAKQIAGRCARLFFYLHSLPHPRLLAKYTEAFDLLLVRWKRRFLEPGEFGELDEHFAVRARRGLSYLGEEDGRRFLVAGVWMAVSR